MASFKDEITRWFKEANKYRREHYMNLSSASVLILICITMLVLWSRFALKAFIQPGEGHWSYAVSAILGVIALITGGVVVASTYWFTSNAPDENLDEREVAQRNRVYVNSFKFIFGAVAVGWVGVEIAPRFLEWSPDLDTVQFYLGCVLISAIFVPPFLFAYSEFRNSSGEEDEASQSTH